MNKIANKRKQEQQVVSLMIKIYCHKKHGVKDGLCDKCQTLNDYAKLRSDLCPFMESKTFCASCKVHCYQNEMREQIKEVMRFSGKWMIIYHPYLTIKHLIDSKMKK